MSLHFKAESKDGVMHVEITASSRETKPAVDLHGDAAIVAAMNFCAYNVLTGAEGIGDKALVRALKAFLARTNGR